MVARMLKKSWAKSSDSMDTTFSELDQPKMRLWHFVDFWHGISLFGIARVIGYPLLQSFHHGDEFEQVTFQKALEDPT